MLVLWTIGILVVAKLVHYFYSQYQASHGDKPEPPGPWGLPIVGYLPFLGKKANITLTNLQPKYGDVFQIQIGGRKIVVVCGQRMIREAALNRGQDFAARPDFYTYRYGFGEFGTPGYTAKNKIFKKITLRAMGMFAHKRSAELQTVAYRAVDMLMDEFAKLGGEPVEPKPILLRVTWTIMGYFSYGRFFNVDDPEVERVFTNLNSFAKTMMFGVLVDYFPWADWLLKEQLRQFRDLMATIDRYSAQLSEQNIKTYAPGMERNISDMFAKAGLDMTEVEKQSLDITDETLKSVVTSLFGAGFGTISATLRWSFLLVAKNQFAQRKVQEEIDEVVGRDRLPTFADQESLPYTMATITEIYRYSSMSALGITHAATMDTQLGGYHIAAGTPVVFNYYSAHRDPTHYRDPEAFDPTRFLHADGTLNKGAVESIMPFGLGARRCGGEQIARAEVFLFFASIMQRCDLREHPDHPLDPSNYFFGLGIDPLPFKMSFHFREGVDQNSFKSGFEREE